MKAKRYIVKRGSKKPNVTITEHEDLAEVMREVFIHGQNDVVRQVGHKPPQRIAVFDRNPGWPHPIFDSQQHIPGGR